MDGRSAANNGACRSAESSPRRRHMSLAATFGNQLFNEICPLAGVMSIKRLKDLEGKLTYHSELIDAVLNDPFSARKAADITHRHRCGNPLERKAALSKVSLLFPAAAASFYAFRSLPEITPGSPRAPQPPATPMWSCLEVNLVRCIILESIGQSRKQVSLSACLPGNWMRRGRTLI